MSVNTENLRKKRGNIRGRITLFAKYVNSLDKSSVSSEQIEELQLRIVSAEQIFREFLEIQSNIESIVDDDELDKQLEVREQIESHYFSTMSLAKYICKVREAESARGYIKNNPHVESIKLPTISLPMYDGALENWLEYRDIFISLIHNSEIITPIQKFHYLRSSLRGSALQVIKSLELSSDNYHIAWDLLTDRYDNNRLLINNHVRSLFSLQSITKESPVQLRKLIDSVQKNLRSLKSMGEPTEYWDTLISYLIVTKLDQNTCKEWENHKSYIYKDSSKVTLNDLMSFIKDRADVLDMVQAQGHKIINVNESSRKSINNNAQNPQQIRSFVSNKIKRLPCTSVPKLPRLVKCIMCDGNHALYACIRFLNLTVQDRINFITGKELCFNCLRAGHSVDECQYRTCKQCSQKHNSLIHVDNNHLSCNSICMGDSFTHTDAAPSDPATVDGSFANTSSLHCSESKQIVQSIALEQVLLSTALVEVCNDNIRVVARILLDNGSQCSFIKESLCKKLRLNTLQSTLTITGVGNTVLQSQQTCNLLIRSRVSSFSTHIQCYVLPKITHTLPNTRIDISKFKIPMNVTLADPEYHTPSDIDILIGADVFWGLLQDGRIRLSNGPYLQNTQLGWIISGTLYNNIVNKINSNVLCCNTLSTSLDSQLKRFWELEEVGCSKPNNNIYTADDRLCEELFTSTSIRDKNGRFAVRIPFRSTPDSLGDSYQLAKNRFLSLERKLDRMSDLKIMYSDFLKEYLALGHMSQINTYKSPYYFLPHHCVLRDSTTTKLRVVFDASAPTTSGKSLNDLQFVGPQLLNDLVAVLLRFRQFAFVACADIEKMYRQVLIQPDQRNLQLILWRENKSEPLSIFQLNTVTYGTASAPYLAMRCIRQLALECADERASQIMLNSFYVDDLIFSHNNKQDLLLLCKTISNALSAGCLPLRKWAFNFDVTGSPSDSFIKSLSLDKTAQCKTLGLNWCSKSDELHFKSHNNIDSKQITKRKILSFVSQVFDPLGFLAPIVISAKILIQKLWFRKLDWDEVVPADLALMFDKILKSFQHLNKVRIPRHVTSQYANKLQLHIFCDSSQEAYGACVYIRSICERSNEISVKLLCAKSKVAPLKPVSIPRLELTGALVAARLYKRIVDSVNYIFDKIYFWTDSMIVLGWLRTHPTLLKTFVQNRVVEINDLTSGCVWSHVEGTNNPADLLSRGINLSELINNDVWWSGPKFIQDSNFINSNSDLSLSVLPELKSHVTVSHSQGGWFPFHRFSSFMRMIRAAAYVLRFIHNTRNKTDRRFDILSVHELHNSTILLARLSQIESFSQEYDSFVNKKNNIKYSRNMSGLNLFFSSESVIRVGGRLSNAHGLAYDKKYPILLCSKHRFTFLLFIYRHKYLCHAGPQLLLSTIREEWWPLGGRNLARTVVHKCVKCVRLTGNTFNPIMGNLPNERTIPGFPFLRTGTDFCGPVYILNRKGRGSRLVKCYICIFICFTTRAVHLELVSSLSTETFLLCLKRFISRRGKPAEIHSDNGKNYVGAANELGQFLKNNCNEIAERVALDNIVFKFIPAYSPHFGGLWEAGVRSCKFHLRRVVGNSNLTFEEFETVLVQIEAVLNSRPLTPLPADANDLQALTPAHFLIGRILTSPYSKDVSDVPTNRLLRYDRIEQMRQHFWRRWSKEYVSELQVRTKWKTNKSEVIINKLVLIKDDNAPPLKWRLGRVEQVFTGSDGISRVARIRTANGEVQRSFSKLCPLPVETHDSSEIQEIPAREDVNAAGIESSC